MTRVSLLTVAAMAALGVAVVAQSKPQMPADVGAGRVAWFDISTSNVARAKEFYGKLFGWTFAAVEGTDQAAEINSRGVAIGTIRSADGPISGFNGVVYIQVEDVRRAGESATALGGTIVEGFPFNLPNGTGAISIIKDPSAHPLGLYSRARLPE